MTLRIHPWLQPCSEDQPDHGGLGVPCGPLSWATRPEPGWDLGTHSLPVPKNSAQNPQDSVLNQPRLDSNYTSVSVRWGCGGGQGGRSCPPNRPEPWGVRSPDGLDDVGWQRQLRHPRLLLGSAAPRSRNPSPKVRDPSICFRRFVFIHSSLI